MKKFWSILLVVALSIGLCAAGFASENKIEVAIWHTFTDDQDLELNKIANAFNASQDKYFVKVQTQPYSGFRDNVYNAVANGVGPSIIFDYASTAADYVPDGLVFDLKPYVYGENGMADIVDSLPERVLSEATGFDDGGMHYLSAYTTGPIFYYNKTLFDELGLTIPDTWEGVAEVAKAITEAKGILGMGIDGIADFMHTLLLQNDCGYIDTEAKEVLFDNDIALEQLKWLGEQLQPGYFALTPTGDYWSDDFNAGLCGFYYGSCTHVDYMEPNGFEYAVAPVPRGETVEWYPSWNRGPIAFNKGDEVNEGTYEFIKFFLQPENNLSWIISAITLSSYGTTQAEEGYAEFVASNPGLEAVSVNLDVAGSLPSVTGAYAVRKALEEAMVMVSGGMDAAEALKNCVETSNAALKGK